MDKARGEQGWLTLQERFDSGEAFEAEVSGFNKGGLLVNVEGVNAFVPLSQVVGVRPDRNREDGESSLGEVVGKSLRLKVIETTYLLVGAACILILGLFALAQLAGQLAGPAQVPGGSPIRMWSHVLHGGLIALFLGRSVWVRHRGIHRLELSRFMPVVWLSFLAPSSVKSAIYLQGESCAAPAAGFAINSWFSQHKKHIPTTAGLRL